MNEDELIVFLDELIQNNNTEGAQLAMEQLCQILDRSGIQKPLVDKVRTFIKYGPEMGQLHDSLKNAGYGRSLTIDDMNDAIQRGKRREYAEEQARNQGRC
ncbi:hypothetical protein [Butyrivibrio sp. VCB2006]|uniref:hypothetical protein n=1 Tax=Butyrivibrio sp. VCB2006 TaxID=1280679 RepID=UPI0004203522|nr:hypothetical protein [Butyrivibrio sp. VCB2006]